jgi:hypothetical protein
MNAMCRLPESLATAFMFAIPVEVNSIFIYLLHTD